MTIQIVFLLLPKVHLLDLAGPAQVFYEANALGGVERFNLTYAATRRHVASAQGLGFGPLRPLDELSLGPMDLVCVPGVELVSFQRGDLREAIAEAHDWIWAQRRAGARIASICSGALLLGEWGLLDHVQCTTHWKCLGYLRERHPRARVLDDRLYVGDRGIHTSAGMTAGTDMTLAFIEQWINPLLAANVAREMVVSIRRQEIKSQEHIFLDFKNHLNPHVYQAQQIIENRLEQNPTLEAVAAELHLSPRHLARLFRERTGMTLQDYKTRRRLEMTRHLLENSEMTVKEAARRAGFADASQLTKAWKKQWPDTPGQVRRKVETL